MRTIESHPSLPFARSYWVQPGRLLAGFLPGDRDPGVAAHKLGALLDLGIGHVINLMEPAERDHGGRIFDDYVPVLRRVTAERGAHVTWQRRPIHDLGTPTPAAMQATLDAVDAGLASERGVYIHCWGGRGRTGTVVGCWLMRHGLAHSSSVLAHLATLTGQARPHFPDVPETLRQKQFVQTWRFGL